jgi:hypothetical protein
MWFYEWAAWTKWINYSRLGHPSGEGGYSWVGYPIREWGSIFANPIYSWVVH